MKKRYILAIVLSAMMLSFTVSCSKSDENVPVSPETPDNPIISGDPIGVYNPGKKIHKLYKSSNYQEKHLCEVWNWNGELLESIDHFDEEENWNYKENYTYDNKNRLTRIDCYGSQSSYVVLEYNDTELLTAKIYEANNLRISYAFTYRNSKLSEYSEQWWPSGRKEEYQLLWSGNNVEKKLLIEIEEGEVWTETISFTYDGKKNPMKGFLAPIVKEDDFRRIFCLSENNFIRYKYDKENSETFVDFVYQYDSDGYPLSFTEITDNPIEYTYYFEYK